MDEYLERRQQLINVDRARRIDASPSAKDVSLARLSQDADSIFREIRALEAESIWGPESDPPAAVDDPTHIFPGMAFLTGERSRAYPSPHDCSERCSTRYHPQDRTV